MTTADATRQAVVVANALVAALVVLAVTVALRLRRPRCAPPEQQPPDAETRVCASADASGPYRRRMSAVAAPVTARRSAGASSMSKPRRPPLTKTDPKVSALSSSTVARRDF